MEGQIPLLEVDAVSKRYAGAPEAEAVLRRVSLRVGAGESVAIVGPSGSGKSTLLNLIGGLDLPSAGEIRFKGREQSRWSAQEMATFRNTEIGLVFQLHHLLPQCTVLENVLVPAMVHAARDAARARAVALLERVGLKERMEYRPGQLSGGERQRAAVVRALINRPSLLLADEPTGSLSESGADELAALLLELNREEEMALLVVTHSMRVARRMDRVLELHGGALVEAGAGPR